MKHPNAGGHWLCGHPWWQHLSVYAADRCHAQGGFAAEQLIAAFVDAVAALFGAR